MPQNNLEYKQGCVFFEKTVSQNNFLGVSFLALNKDLKISFLVVDLVDYTDFYFQRFAPY